jgi:hypothetical protein
MGHMMTIEQATALYLDISRLPTGNLQADLVASAQVAQRWRTIGPEATAVIVHALHRHIGLSLREIQQQTNIPHESARRMVERLESGHWGTVPE